MYIVYYNPATNNHIKLLSTKEYETIAIDRTERWSQESHWRHVSLARYTPREVAGSLSSHYG